MIKDTKNNMSNMKHSFFPYQACFYVFFFKNFTNAISFYYEISKMDS